MNPMHPDQEKHSEWTFLSNHAHTLFVLARDPEARLRDVAELVGITERAVQRIVADLETKGYLKREKIGRRNRYRIHPQLPLRHPIEAHRSISDLLRLLLTEQELSALLQDAYKQKTELSTSECASQQ